MIKKLQEAQKQMKVIKDRLDSISVEGRSRGGEVTVTATGNRKITSVRFSQNVPVIPNEMEPQLIEAINNAIAKADEVNEAEMKVAAGSMMPGLGGMFGK